MAGRLTILHHVLCPLMSGLGLLAASGSIPATAQTRTAMAVMTAAPSAGDQPIIESLDLPVAVAARMDRLGSATKLTFDLSKSASARAYALENPDRLVIETSAISFQVDPAVGRLRPDASNPVRSFRFGQFAPGKSRIVIDLTGPARVQTIDVASIAGGDPSRLSIVIAKCERAAFRNDVARAQASEPAPTTVVGLEPLASVQARPVIVIDPGHGGVDPGANGVGGVVEKRVVFDFATALADKLKAAGRYDVVLTRRGDTFVSLGQRVKIAQDARASLLVSIHADTIASGSDVTGATVYTVSDRASDGEAERVAETENKADEVAGVDSAPDATDVSDILADLTRRETRTYSHTFQRTLAGYWQKIGRLNKNPQRSAGFRVLKAPDVPSVLLELGYLSSDKDVAAMTSPEWRDKATGSIVASINTFFAARTAGAEAVDGSGLSAAGDPDKTAVVVLQPHP